MRKNAKETELSEWVRLWLLRLFAPRQAVELLVKDKSFQDDDLAGLLGLHQWVECEREEFNAESVRKELKEQLLKLEASIGKQAMPALHKSNLDRLGRVLGLNLIDKQVLLLVAVSEAEPAFSDALNLFRRQTVLDCQTNFARMLNVSLEKIRPAMSKRGALFETCILRWQHGQSRTGWCPEFATNSFAEKLMDEDFAIGPIIQTIAPQAPAATLKVADFSHLGKHLNLLLPYLREALQSRRAGVNVFLYGPPGTGKSELVRVLSRELRAALYEVAFEDADRDAVDGSRRLEALRASQMLLARRRSLLVFDEAEDVFVSGSIFRRSLAQGHKAWINRALETNPVPTVWIANSIEGLDPAFARRFDYVLEIDSPPRHQRERVLSKVLPRTVSSQLLQRLSRCDELTPAVVARATGVAQQVQRQAPHLAQEETILHLVCQTLKAQGHRHGALDANEDRVPAVFDLSLLNSDLELQPIAAQLTTKSSCRMCLYGPPGTGKTTFGYWLAERLGVPIHAKRVSDILAPYVGQSEQRLNRVFQNAKQEGAILLLDEVDSFLQDRRQAVRSWEVTLVNELLTQMENFTGIFMASTNLMQGLDAASLRRFDLKIRFGYLQPEQNERLLRAHSSHLNLPAFSAEDISRAHSLSNAAPGDFANVARQHRFRSFETVSAFLDALEHEGRLKHEGSNRKVGFC